MKTLAWLLTVIACASVARADVTHYVRYQHVDTAHYGVVDGDRIHQLTRAPWLGGRKSGSSVSRDNVRLLAPVEPGKVFAVGYNYHSHRGDRELPPHPPIFLKLPSAIVGPGAPIRYPQDANELHFEAELVIVIGKTAWQVSETEAGDYIFGVTAGNDVSERQWQANDLQWFRAKATDTFGPVGPRVARGLDYRDLLVQSRLNGQLMQSQRTRDHIHDAHAIVSYVSQYATLDPGDVIFTGTPGDTSAMQPGDVIEIEVEGVGVLRNTIVREPSRN